MNKNEKFISLFKVAFEDALDRSENSIRTVLSAIKQSIITVDGIIAQLIIAFPGFLPKYKPLSALIAGAFSELALEALRLQEVHGTFQDLKDFRGRLKQSLNRQTRSSRMEVFLLLEESDFIYSIYGKIFEKFYKYLEFEYCTNGVDYTNTPAYLARIAVMAQTRYSGYVPVVQTELKAEEFRELISREPIVPTEKEICMVYEAVTKELENSKMPKHLLGKTKIVENEALD